MIVNAFTCTGAYAVLIMSGQKRVENRSCLPVPASGRCAMSVSKKFCRVEYDGIKAGLRRFNGDRVDAIIPTWEEASRWPCHIVAVVDYQAIDAEPEEEPWRVQAQFWNEGYRYWWLLSNIRKLPAPIPCRGNSGEATLFLPRYPGAAWRKSRSAQGRLASREKFGEPPVFTQARPV